MESSECKNNELVIRHDDDHVSHITLNHPNSKNALSKGMINKMIQTLDDIKRDGGLKVVIIRGANGSFCSGADLHWMKQGLSQTDAQNKQDAELFYQLFSMLYTFPKPIVIWVEKVAYGGAIGLLACADYVIADKSVTLAFSEVKLGLVPATIAPFVLKKIGLANAKALMLTGHSFKAKQAKKIGLINEVLANRNIPKRINELSNQFKSNSAPAMRVTKQLLNKLTDNTLNENEVRDICCLEIAVARTSPDGREGVNAFFEKRPTAWNK